MKHPAYQLRPNKAVDRMMLVDVLKYLEKLGDLSAYTYYGLGGPYLEDFRMMYDLCPDIRLVCIEENQDTRKRQKFHLPCRNIKLVLANFTSFVKSYQPNDEKSIFWLDYTRLEFANFEDFMSLLGCVTDGSVIKISMPADPRRYEGRSGYERFQAEFGVVMPADAPETIPWRYEPFSSLIQKMLQVAAEKALPSAMPHIFQPICSFCYSDGTGMLTLTGIICQRGHETEITAAFKNWKSANLRWNRPRRIDVPFLSTKERLHLEKHLPSRSSNPGNALHKALGYLIDDSVNLTELKLNEYAEYNRYYPYFVKAVP